VRLDKLVKRVRREAAANPKKAAVLGILVLLGLYFWGPLVKGWFVKNDPASKVPGETPLAASTASAATPGGPTGGQQVAAHAWYQVVQWIEQDPRTRAAGDPAARRDPFQPVKPAVAEPEANKKPEPPKPRLSLASLPVQLSSTVVGWGPRLAVINGKTCREGDTIEVTKDGCKTALKLAEVHARRVVLRRENESLEVALPERKRSGRLELSSSHK